MQMWTLVLILLLTPPIEVTFPFDGTNVAAFKDKPNCEIAKGVVQDKLAKNTTGTKIKYALKCKWTSDDSKA